MARTERSRYPRTHREIGARMKKIYQAIFNRENLLALLLALILIALLIFTAETSPTWIYQGF